MTTIRTLADLDGQPHANVFQDAEPKTIKLTLGDGDGVPPHTHPGRDIVFFLIDGRVELQLGTDRHQLTGGDVIRFDGGQEISPQATEDSTALIVLSPRSDD